MLYLCPYDKIEEAVDYMNNREKPLSGYLFTNDKKIKEYVRDNTSSGCLDINETLLHFSSKFLPFGGVGNSGMSAYHGKWGFDNMSHLKPVIDQASILFSVRYPPYSKSSIKLVDEIICAISFIISKMKLSFKDYYSSIMPILKKSFTPFSLFKFHIKIFLF